MKSELVSTLVIVAALIVYFVIKRKNTKASSWKGELIKKRDLTDEDDKNHVYRLLFKTDSGKRAKVSVSEDIYNQAQVGDRYEKLPGFFIPKKI